MFDEGSTAMASSSGRRSAVLDELHLSELATSINGLSGLEAFWGLDWDPFGCADFPGRVTGPTPARFWNTLSRTRRTHGPRGPNTVAVAEPIPITEVRAGVRGFGEVR